jgi:uncharacterized protein YidB (DUF937 family)
MARNSGFPSMTALLGLLAVAGYQNREKISEMLKGLGGGVFEGNNGAPAGAPGGAPKTGLEGVLAGLGKTVGDAGGLLGGGLGELVDQFRKNGVGEAADSWVRTGPNQEIAPPQVKKAIGDDVLDALAQQTGLSKDEILKRLSRELPTAVDRYTPNGRLPG